MPCFNKKRYLYDASTENSLDVLNVKDSTALLDQSLKLVRYLPNIPYPTYHLSEGLRPYGDKKRLQLNTYSLSRLLPCVEYSVDVKGLYLFFRLKACI